MPKPAKAGVKRSPVSAKPKPAKQASEPVDVHDVISKLAGKGRSDKSPMTVAERRELARRAARTASWPK